VIRTGTTFRIAGLVAAAVLMVSACSGSSATQAPASQAAASQAAASQASSAAPASQGAGGAISIGIEGPFTGPNALTGTEIKNAYNMAFDAINWTVGNYKITPVYIDDQSDPAKGAAAYEQAVASQKIIAGVGGWHSSVAVAQMEVTAKYQVPHFFALGAANTINEKWSSDPSKYGYWTAKGWPVPDKLVVGYVQTLNDAIAAGTFKPATKTVALFGEDTDWGRTVVKALKDQMTATGWTVSDEDYFAQTQTDFSSIVARYKSQNVAAIAGTTTFPDSMSAFIKQIDDAGLKSVVVADGLGWIGDWYKLTGSASDYVIDQIPGWTTDKAKKFADDYKAKFGATPSPSAAGLSYDYANFFIKILNQTIADQGSLTSATIYKEAQDKLWTGQLTYTDGIIMPSYDYSKDTLPDMVVGSGHFTFPVIQYHGGQGTTIWPANIATGKFEVKP
jgi:branched-chain amino acid transport system substrate-binding protein